MCPEFLQGMIFFSKLQCQHVCDKYFHIIEDFDNAHQFSKILSLWDDDRRRVYDVNQLKTMINKHLIVHPIKWSDVKLRKFVFKQSLQPLPDRDKKAIIIQTNNPPNKTIQFFLDQFPQWQVIIVAETNIHDHLWLSESQIDYLSLSRQASLFPKLDKLITSIWARKNIGYLYAIKNNYTIIYDANDTIAPPKNMEKYWRITKS